MFKEVILQNEIESVCHVKPGDLFKTSIPMWSFLKKTNNHKSEYYRNKKIKNYFLPESKILLFLGKEKFEIENKTFQTNHNDEINNLEVKQDINTLVLYKFLIEEDFWYILQKDFEELFKGKYIIRI